MNAHEKHLAWMHFASTAVAGYLALHSDPDLRVPKSDDVGKYASEIAFEMVKRAEFAKKAFEHEEQCKTQK